MLRLQNKFKVSQGNLVNPVSIKSKRGAGNVA